MAGGCEFYLEKEGTLRGGKKQVDKLITLKT